MSKHDCEACIHKVVCALWEIQNELCDSECAYYQPTLTPPNEPLTIEQLREMDGKAAYVPETNCWVLVTKNPFVPLFTWPDGEQCSAYDWYEQVGPVYRRPPEGDGDA